jgi:hypothetical protein
MNRAIATALLLLAVAVITGCGGGTREYGGKAFAARYVAPLEGFLSPEDFRTSASALESAYNDYERAIGPSDRARTAHRLAEVATAPVIHSLGAGHPTTYTLTQDFNQQLAMLPVQARIDAALPLVLFAGKLEEGIKNGFIVGQVVETKVIEGIQARFPELRKGEGPPPYP